VKYSHKALNVLTCLSYKGIGKAWIFKHTETFQNKNSLVALLDQSVKGQSVSLTDFNKRKSAIIVDLMQQAGAIDGVIAMGDDDFPQHRGNVKNSEKPVVLFYKGDITLLKPKNKNMAVIGLLEPDASTEHSERLLINRLVLEGVTVISGLAYGCDAIAHEQTVRCNGKTVAILPSPLHNILPRGNKTLAMDIVKCKGLLVTEYLYDASSKLAFTARYQERDRLQALFSDVVILAASYAKNSQGNDSGARLAMEYARQYDITRAVMYDTNINSNNSKYDLNRQLIHEQSDITVIEQANNMNDLDDLLIHLPKQGKQNIQHSLF
jgi:DNA processing protein